jgi:hypothetical protein
MRFMMGKIIEKEQLLVTISRCAVTKERLASSFFENIRARPECDCKGAGGRASPEAKE